MAEKKQRKPTSTDVAELAGVSQTSVSLVLSGSSRATFSEQTRARVFEAARQLGYQPPAHRTRKKNGNDRRLILVLTPTLANQYYSELIQTLDDMMKIQSEGREKRIAAEAEMAKMENDLKGKLLEIRGGV